MLTRFTKGAYHATLRVGRVLSPISTITMNLGYSNPHLPHAPHPSPGALHHGSIPAPPPPPPPQDDEEYDPTDPRLFVGNPGGCQQPSTSRLDEICSALAHAQQQTDHLASCDTVGEAVPGASCQVMPQDCIQAFKKARKLYTAAAKANQHRDPCTVKYCTTHHLNMTDALIPAINTLTSTLNRTLSQLQTLTERVDKLEEQMIQAGYYKQSRREAPGKRQRME